MFAFAVCRRDSLSADSNSGRSSSARIAIYESLHPRSVTAVTQTIPSHLRLHRPTQAGAAAAEPQRTVDPIEQFWSVFASTTGFRVDSRRGPSDDPSGEESEIQLIASNESASGRLSNIEATESMPVGREAAQRIASAGATIATELQKMRGAILRSEGELAMRASLLADADVAEDLQGQLEQMMADAVAATGTTAAVLSMLDDDTEMLRVASIYGMPPIAMATLPRQLRGSRGDLEAMVNRVVLADGRTGSMDTYCPPKMDGVAEMSGGICVVIRSADLPIGTLWLMMDEFAVDDEGQTKLFDHRDAAAARLAGSSIEQSLAIAAKANGHSSVTAAAAAASPTQQSDALIATGEFAQWQYISLPAAATLADGWRADGWIESNMPWVTGWHAWDVLPDGTIMIAMADIDGLTMTDAMAAATARTSLQSHSSYRHSTADMLRRISDTLWQSNAIMSPISMFYAHLDPETGAGQYSSAGQISAIIGNRYGVRPLLSGNSEPMGVHIDCKFNTNDFNLRSGETLLGYDAGLSTGSNQQKLGQWLTDSLRSGTQHPLAAIRRQMAGGDISKPLGAITLMRS